MGCNHPLFLTALTIILMPLRGKDEFKEAETVFLTRDYSAFILAIVLCIIGASISDWNTLAIVYVVCACGFHFLKLGILNPFFAVFGFRHYRVIAGDEYMNILTRDERPNGREIPEAFRIDRTNYIEI